MSRQSYCRDRECLIFAIAASIVVAIVAAVLQFTAIITVAPVFYWVLFGIAVGYLAVVLVVSALGCNSCTRYCFGKVLTALLAGILGTILFAVILLGVGFAATSVLGAIFLGLLVGSFALTVTTTACLISCVAADED